MDYKSKKINVTEILLEPFDTPTILESMADFVSEDVFNERFIMLDKTVREMSRDSDIADKDKELLVEVLKTKADMYIFIY